MIFSMTPASPSSYLILSFQVGSDTDMPWTEYAGIVWPTGLGARVLVAVATDIVLVDAYVRKSRTPIDLQLNESDRQMTLNIEWCTRQDMMKERGYTTEHLATWLTTIHIVVVGVEETTSPSKSTFRKSSRTTRQFDDQTACTV